MSVEREVIGNTVRWYWADDTPKRKVLTKKKAKNRAKAKAARKQKKAR
jgi:hypothetical protein